MNLYRVYNDNFSVFVVADDWYTAISEFELLYPEYTGSPYYIEQIYPE